MRAADDLAEQGLNVLLINAGENADVAARFWDQEGLDFRTLVDESLMIRDVYVGELTPAILADKLAVVGLEWRP